VDPASYSRRWVWSQKSDYARLRREFESFRIDLAFSEARDRKLDKCWTRAASDQLANVLRYLGEENSVEAGWHSLHAAKRYAIHGLDAPELSRQASILRAESEKFASSWRSKEIKHLLSVKDEQLTADHIIDAMALRDEYFSNQYHKIWLVGNQLVILLVSCGFGLSLLIPLLVYFSRHANGIPPPWGYQMVTGVLFFGLLGAAFSAAGSLMNTDASTRIPERVANQFVTLARALFGSGAGLAGYAFYQSKGLNIHFGGDGDPGSGLAIAFIFGFFGERLIAQVLGALGTRQS
jgi:hypothetical protein